MPDAKAGSWAALNGAEILNSQRTIAYINNFNLPIEVDQECWCPSILDLLGESGCTPSPTGTVDPDGYSFPSTDPAPWYDPAIPESGDFLGFLMTEFDGLGSTYTRSTFDILSGGAILGKLRAQARTLTWRGFMFGRTCCATEYGLRWLTAQLAGTGGCNDCNDNELDILYCCPEVTGNVPSPSCGARDPDDPARSCETGELLPSGDIPPFSQSAAEDAFRTFHKVGLFDGPTRGIVRALGCGSCEDSGGGCLMEFEFTLIAGNPFMHRDPVIVCPTMTFTPCTTCTGQTQADGDFWKKLTTTVYPATEEDADICEDKLACTASPADCNQDPSCPIAELPTVPEFIDPCGCEALFVTERCCHISNDVYGKFFEGVPQIEIYSGDKPLYNVTVKFYENPQERDCDDNDLFDICNLCDSLTVRYIPEDSCLTIDGLTKRVSITCPGNNIQPAENLLVSNFRWPVLSCIDYIVKIEADCCAKPPIALIREKTATVDTLNGQPGDVLKVSSTAGFPTSGTVTVGEFTMTYTGVTAKSFTGVNSQSSKTTTVSKNTQVIGQSTDTDCTQGVSSLATSKITVIPREM